MRGDFDEDEYDDGDDCCDACMGEGFYHDCGDDTCCCLNPDVDFVYVCEACHGSGGVR